MNIYPIGVIFPDCAAIIKREDGGALHLEPKIKTASLRGNESAFDECRTVYKIESDGTFKMVKSTTRGAK